MKVEKYSGLQISRRGFLRRAARIDNDQLGIVVKEREGVDHADEEGDRADDRDEAGQEQKRESEEGTDRLALAGDEVEFAESTYSAATSRMW